MDLWERRRDTAEFLPLEVHTAMHKMTDRDFALRKTVPGEPGKATSQAKRPLKNGAPKRGLDN